MLNSYEHRVSVETDSKEELYLLDLLNRAKEVTGESYNVICYSDNTTYAFSEKTYQYITRIIEARS